jgi:hypothetical protein
VCVCKDRSDDGLCVWINLSDKLIFNNITRSGYTTRTNFFGFAVLKRLLFITRRFYRYYTKIQQIYQYWPAPSEDVKFPEWTRPCHLRDTSPSPLSPSHSTNWKSLTGSALTSQHPIPSYRHTPIISSHQHKAAILVHFSGSPIPRWIPIILYPGGLWSDCINDINESTSYTGIQILCVDEDIRDMRDRSLLTVNT